VCKDQKCALQHLSTPVHGDIDRKHSYYLEAIGHRLKANLPGAATEAWKRGREAIVYIV